MTTLEDFTKGVQKTQKVAKVAEPYVVNAARKAEVEATLRDNDGLFTNEQVEELLRSGNDEQIGQALQVIGLKKREDDTKKYEANKVSFLDKASSKSLENVLYKIEPQEDEDGDRLKLRKGIFNLEATLDAYKHGNEETAQKATQHLQAFAQEFQQVYVSNRVVQATQEVAAKLSGYSENLVKAFQSVVGIVESSLSVRKYQEEFGDDPEKATRGYLTELKKEFADTFPEENRDESLRDYATDVILKLSDERAVDYTPELRKAA